MRRIHRFTITLSFCSRDDRVLSKMRIKVSLVSTSLAESILFSMVVLLTFSAHMFLLLFCVVPFALNASHEVFDFLGGDHFGELMECLADLARIGLGGGSRIEDGHNTGIALTTNESTDALAELDQHIGGAVSVHEVAHVVAGFLLFFHKCASHREGQSYNNNGREAVADTVNAFPHRAGSEQDTILGLLEVGDSILVASGHADGVVCGQLVLQKLMHEAKRLIGGEEDCRMAVGGLDDLINLIGNGLEVVLAIVIRDRHSLGDIQSCVLCVIKGRLGTGLEEQTMGNVFQSVFCFEVFEVCAVRDRAGGQYMAHITIPHLGAENVIDVLSRASRERTPITVQGFRAKQKSAVQIKTNSYSYPVGFLLISTLYGAWKTRSATGSACTI